MPDLILTPDELVALTGYRRPSDQLRELQRRGFGRARIGATGSVILERAHYEAVCRGQQPAERPRVRVAQVRHPHAA